MKRDFYIEITDSIIRKIESGAGQWQMPWHCSGYGVMPKNPIADRKYQGVNVLQLWCEQQERGYATPLWASYKQWQSKGAQVRKGECGTMVVYVDRFIPKQERERADTDGDDPKSFGFLKSYFVFNADQVDGYSVDTDRPLPALAVRIEHAETFVANTAAIVQHGGDRAFYQPSTDSVQMPLREAFKDTETSTATENYYSTLFHELTHWTGHEKRCAREFGKRFGNDAYAAEELVAELGAAFLCGDLGLSNEPRQDHSQYIESWLNVLKADKKAIFTAAAKAQAAVDYMHNLQSENAIAA